MKERPILFSGPMIRALLEGRKTQTRRLVKLPRDVAAGELRVDPGGTPVWGPGPYLKYDSAERPDGDRLGGRIYCPYGYPEDGDRLWVRETWSKSALSVYPCPPCWYRADFTKYDDPTAGEHTCPREDRAHSIPHADCFGCAADYHGRFRWRPGIHMPRALSRITLEVTGVRVERLQDISEEDARAEGVSVLPLQSADDPSAWFESAPGENASRTARGAFRLLWDSLNAKRAPWASNPFVWCISFRRRLDVAVGEGRAP